MGRRSSSTAALARVAVLVLAGAVSAQPAPTTPTERLGSGCHGEIVELEWSRSVLEIAQTAERTNVTFELVTKLRATQRRQARDGALIALMLLVFAGLLVYYRHAFLHGHRSRR